MAAVSEGGRAATSRNATDVFCEFIITSDFQKRLVF